jgi:uncharacterized phage protein gp47/JayE
VLLEYRTALQTLDGIIALLADEVFIAEIASVENKTVSQVQTDISGFVDQFGGNYNLIRKTSNTANGFAYFGRFDPPTFDIAIPTGTQIKTLDEKYYETTAATANATMTVAGNFYIPSLNQHAIKVPIAVLADGVAGNAVSGSINVLVSQISGIQFVTNIDSISNGIDAETDLQFIEKIKSRLAGNNFATINGIKNIIKDNFLTIKDLAIITPSNSLMKRDEGYGGKVDIYVLDETDPITIVDNYNVFDVTGPAGQDGFVLNQQPVAEETAATWLVNSGLILDWHLIKDSTSTLSQSNFERSFIYFDSTYVLPITVSYKYYEICMNIYNLLLSDEYFFIGNVSGTQNPVDSTILVKKAIKRLLNATFKMVIFPGFDIALTKANISSAINDFVNTLLLGDRVALSDIVAVAEAVEGVDYIDFTGGVFDLDGTGFNVLLTPLETEYIRVGTIVINT